MAMLTDVALEKMLWDFADGKSIQFRLPCGDLVWWEGQSGGVCPGCGCDYKIENQRLESL
jgi:hypothetical protein